MLPDQLAGLPDERSVNETVCGAGPDTGVPLKLTTGDRADAGKIVIGRRNRKKREDKKYLLYARICFVTTINFQSHILLCSGNNQGVTNVTWVGFGLNNTLNNPYHPDA